MSASDATTAPPPAARILTVCSHNRTRSVMVAAMLQARLNRRLGAGRVAVRSAGFGPVDLAAIPDAVDAMRQRGLDVSGHRSRSVTPALVDHADLILTAERDHVVRIATMSPPAFPRAVTLPEFLTLAATEPPGTNDPMRQRVEALTARRTAADYLRGGPEEIADPTGLPTRDFDDAVFALEQQCAEAAAVIARFAGR